MTIQLALDKATNDLIKLDSGGVARVKDGRFVIQQVRSSLKVLLGEWYLDKTIGWLNFEDYSKDPDMFGIELRSRKVILGVAGVQKIDTFSLTLTDRVLYLRFTATTIYGGIELTVPWSY